MAHDKKLYALINIASGVETECITTTDFTEAQKHYQK